MSITSTVPPLKRRELAAQAITPIHRPRNWSKADVSLVEWPAGSGQQLVIKDFARRPLWFRIILGRMLLRREWRALRALQDIEAVPTAHHRIDADGFIMEYCPGQKVDDVSEEDMPPGLVSHIEDLVKAIHARGVTHGDLHASNVLITRQGCGFALIDWATACYFGPQPRHWRKVLFHELSALDDRAIAKLKVTYQPESITDRQRHLLLNGGSAVYRGFKSLRHFMHRLRGRDSRSSRARQIEGYQKRLEQHKSPGGSHTN